MRRKYNHNAKLIQELYGDNLSLDNLLNEQEEGSKAKQAFKNIIRKAKNIKIVKKGQTKAAAVSDSEEIPDALVSFEDAAVQLNDELDDPNLTPERRKQIENVAGQLASVASGDQAGDFSDIERKAAPSGGSGSGDSAGGGEKEADKGGSAPSKGKQAVIEIQKIIDPDAKHTKPDGIWKGGTNKAWHEWVASNFEAINELIEGEEEKLAGDSTDSEIKAHILAQRAGFNPDISGVSALCNAISGGKSNPGDQDLITSFEPLWKIASRKGSVWKGKLDKENIAKHILPLEGDKFEAKFYPDAFPIEIDGYKIVFKIGNYKDMSNIDQATIAIEEAGEYMKYQSNSLVSNLKGSGLNLVDLMNGDGKLIAAERYSLNAKELYRIAVYCIAVKLKIVDDVVLSESFTRFNGMVLGESRASLYRKRYFGRY